MIEQWLKGIYDQGHIIQELHETVRFLHDGNWRESRAVYNTAASHLEELIAEVAKSDVNSAKKIQDCALTVMDAWGDPHLVAGRIESSLIPALFEYMRNFTDICVEENGYLLESADSGFLTVKDLESSQYLHDTHDPMFEAFEQSDQLYSSEMQTFRILGAGLGYLAYILWRRSDTAMMICIYEEDPVILDYADHFGVLSYIDQDCLEIITDKSMQKLGERFLSDIRNDKNGNGRFVTAWKARKYTGICDGLITRLNLTDDSNRMIRKISTINLWKNRQLPSISPDKLKERFITDEWLVVAAGPSFDDNLELILESSGRRNIVAVNTVLRRLSKENIKPDISVAADPYGQLFDHIDDIISFTEDIPLVSDRLTFWKYCKEYRGEKCFVPTTACRFIPDALRDGESVWEVGGTVTSLAIEVAIRMGAKRIYIIGLDLAYPSGLNYAEGMPHARVTNSNVTMEVPSNDGKRVGTNEVFDLFRKSIEEQIAPHKDIEFINCSRYGAKIKGMKVNSL